MFEQLTNHIWQSTLFAIAVALLTVAFRKNRAAIRYVLWFTASLKFCIPLSLLMAVGSYVRWAPVAKRVAAPAISFTMVQFTQPFPNVLPALPSTTGTTVNLVPVAILGAWVCGFVAIVLMRFRGWRRIRAAVRSSSRIDVLATVEVRSSPGLLEPGVVGLFGPMLLLPEGIAERLTPPQLQAVLGHTLPRSETR
jgi:bla regulator protein blaR1